MKKIILTICAIIALSISTSAQAPEGFKYQAVVRGAGNVILNNQSVGMQLAILQGSATGTAVYTETFATSTNAYGLVNLEIGTGTTVNTFSTIDWANGPYFIETAVDVTGGTNYTVMGTSQLMSVPYALHSKTADSALVDMVDDADNDPTNEIQSISLGTDTVYLTNGGYVVLPAASGSNWALNGNDISNTNPGRVGIGTTAPLFDLAIYDTLPEIGIGRNAFNGPASGNFYFQEDVGYNGLCGFQMAHNGAMNTLSLIGGCSAPDTIFNAWRAGYMRIKNLGVGGTLTQIPPFPLTVTGLSNFTGDMTITGNLNVSGAISKGSGTFRIDHPLDPANKYLVHSFVESPDMLNIYSGNIVTDASGFATVTLPEYFEAANKDFRYQLTVIGTFADAIIKEKISNNSFVIQTNEPNVEVSWAVTGVRADKFANENRVQPEEEKEIKGSYVHPELYNMPPSESVNKKKEQLMMEIKESNDADQQ